MPDNAVADLVSRAPISFIGTIDRLGAATMADLPITARTAVVQVVRVLHGPDAFAHLEGQRVTLQLTDDAGPPQVGESAAFFAEGLAFGDTVALREVGRLSLEAVEPHVSSATERGERSAFEPLQRQLRAQRLREHVAGADALVLGRVVRLEDVLGPPVSEHDPDWWKATIDVQHVEKGDVKPGRLEVLFPNSLDVHWHDAPKPKPSQMGMFVLHAAQGQLAEIAPFEVLHPDDYQPVQQLDVVREADAEPR